MEKSMIDLPISLCEICHTQVQYDDQDHTINVSECSHCHRLACELCIDWRESFKKWLCTSCYNAIETENWSISEKPKKKASITLLSFFKH